METFLFGFRSTTYKTSYDVSWKTYEADVKDQSILFNHQAQCGLRSAVDTCTISLQNIFMPTKTIWNDLRYKSHSVGTCKYIN